MKADTASRLVVSVEVLPSLSPGSNIIGGVFSDYAYADSINQQVSTTEVVGSAVDVRRRGTRVIYMNNTEDVSVTITIEGSYDGTDWYIIRSNISLAANEKAIGILTDRHGYVRARAIAAAAPTTGTLRVTVASML